jgi:hypothetical protein
MAGDGGSGVDWESLAEATSGAIGSLVSTTVLYPLDTCKSKFQAELQTHNGAHKYRYRSLPRHPLCHRTVCVVRSSGAAGCDRVVQERSKALRPEAGPREFGPFGSYFAEEAPRDDRDFPEPVLCAVRLIATA